MASVCIFLIEFSENHEETIQLAMEYLKRKEWVEIGTWLVVITNALANDMIIDTLQLRQLEDRPD